ncbi:MAG: hypothetical protein ACI837_000530 [Crocinitomicaceae bacterium]|jgi:hypothetical protein
MRYLVILSLILLGCQNEPEVILTIADDERENPESGVVQDSMESVLDIPHERLELDAYLFCELDDKYSDPADTSKVYPWLRKKTEAILSGTSNEDLFGDGPDSRGGGPNGAHSAPSSDLYLAIEFTAPANASEIRVYVNGVRVATKIDINTDLYWMKFPLKAWQLRLRDIEPKDTLEMFPPGFTGVAGLMTGQVMRVEIHSKDKKITKFLHCWFPNC